MICRYRGCLAAATVGQVCAVHASGRGAHCPDCGGTGTTRARASGALDTCGHCMGTGLVDYRRRAARAAKKTPVDQRGLLVAAVKEDV